MGWSQAGAGRPSSSTGRDRTHVRHFLCNTALRWLPLAYEPEECVKLASATFPPEFSSMLEIKGVREKNKCINGDDDKLNMTQTPGSAYVYFDKTVNPTHQLRPVFFLLPFSSFSIQ